uniref:Cation/H+ exchanger domain-containing protein n=1 Tax=Panagrolaimus davidi TaxID=227884 RepID=A0A914PLD4_9BILA
MATIGSEHLVFNDFLRASGAFFLVAIGGILIGIIGAAATGLTTRVTKEIAHSQPLICLLFPYLAYLIAELGHYSGILSIVVCGLFMKPYVRRNMSEDAAITVKYFLKTIASQIINIFSESYMGRMFIAVTVVSCFVYRFIGTYLFSAICNKFRVEKIGLVEQFIMAYGGLRGAICYGLVMTLDKDSIPAKDMFVSTTVVIIVITVFAQGSTIRPLVHFLQVKKKDNHVPTARDDMMAGVEGIAGIHGQYFWRRRLSQFDREFIRPLMTEKMSSRGDELVEKYNRVKSTSSQARLIQSLNLINNDSNDSPSNQQP